MKTAIKALEDLLVGFKAARDTAKPNRTVTEVYDSYCKGMDDAFNIAISAIERDLGYLREDEKFESQRKF